LRQRPTRTNFNHGVHEAAAVAIIVAFAVAAAAVLVIVTAVVEVEGILKFLLQLVTSDKSYS
jgi:hypothetical protein